MESNRILNLLGLARRGGRIILGDSILPFLSKNTVFVIIASDASENTKKKWHDKCQFYKTECIEYSSKVSIGHALGIREVSVVGLRDKNLISKIKELLKDGDVNGTK